jgi:hypothetical protein
VRPGDALVDRMARAVAILVVVILIASLLTGTLAVIFQP